MSLARIRLFPINFGHATAKFSSSKCLGIKLIDAEEDNKNNWHVENNSKVINTKLL